MVKKRRGRIAKRTLFELVEEARACGMGPRHLARLIGYNHQHMSRIAMALGLPKRERETGPVSWSERLVNMLQSVGADAVDTKHQQRCQNCGTILCGTVRPQETEAA